MLSLYILIGVVIFIASLSQQNNTNIPAQIATKQAIEELGHHQGYNNAWKGYIFNAPSQPR